MKKPTDDFAFQKCHKQQRRLKNTEGQGDILDFHNPIHCQQEMVVEVASAHPSRPVFYTLEQVPGFYFFPNALSVPLQRFLEFQALHVYAKPPFRTNLDMLSPETTEERSSDAECPPTKLSWATLGCHYDWTARSYHRNDVSPMPRELQSVAQYFAVAAMSQNSTTDNPVYSATACIVNYYTTKSSMGGHRDDVEQAVDKPVVSLSLGGRPAVFIIGGSTLDSRPVIPMVVRPGDVVVLSGECRLYYHSMARLLPRELPDNGSTVAHALCLEDIASESSLAMDGEKEKGVLEYLQDRRINVNLRQVYNDDK